MFDRSSKSESEYSHGTAGEAGFKKEEKPSQLTKVGKAIFDYTIPIDVIGNPYPANLYLINRSDLLFTFTKIQLWRQTQFKNVVYIDSDVVALRAPDELFDIEDDFAAAPDVGFPDIFNSGVLVLKPNMGDYWALRNMAAAGDSFDGADQGLLNQYYEHKGWKRLSFTYNCTPSANYQYEPAYRYYKRDISLVHFIGKEKPWQKGRASDGPPGAYQELVSRWWAVYDRTYKVSVGCRKTLRSCGMSIDRYCRLQTICRAKKDLVHLQFSGKSKAKRKVLITDTMRQATPWDRRSPRRHRKHKQQRRKHRSLSRERRPKTSIKDE